MRPEFADEDPHNRRWGFESAAADLALRQAERSLHDHSDYPQTGLEPSPLDPRPEPIGFRRAEGAPF